MSGGLEIMEAQRLWEPDSKRNTSMDRFRAAVTAAYGIRLGSRDEWSLQRGKESTLQQQTLVGKCSFVQGGFSCANLLVNEPSAVPAVIDPSKGITDVPEWFKGSRLNYAENLLKHEENDKIALYAAREGKEEIEKVTFDDLRHQVAFYAAAMRKLGVQPGDRVVGYLPNSIHAVEAMLAAASMGAIWSATSPDFGINGVLDRFSQIQPKLIFSVEAVVYNGKRHNHLDKLQRVVKVVVIPYVSSRESIDISRIPNSVFLEDFLGTGQGDQAPQLEFEQLPFSHPLFIMYSSGTTGAPKCMVHSAGVEEINFPRLLEKRMPEIINHKQGLFFSGHRITILGTGAKWLAVLEEKNLKPRETHNLQTLHTILSTGSPLKSQSYEYVYQHIKSSVLLGSISGGTDIISCFMGHNVTIPVYKGEIQARNLAMAVEAWNEQGEPVWGENGELVCTKPIPCQPTHFWNDENRSKYRKAYFSRFPGTDGTLNPSGVRFGSSEIYNIVEAFEEVSDSLCVPQYNKDGEERVVLFLKMATNHEFSPDLVKRIREAIRVALSARHVPSIILETEGIPYTISGKKVEVAVKQIIAGKEVAKRDIFSNPETLNLYSNIPELQGF
ncbi:hypothetical protein Chor_008223 [Crotalus horridus]